MTESQRRIVEGYVQALVDNDLEHATRMGQRIVGATRNSRAPIPAHVMGNALAEWDREETKHDLYRGLVGQKGGRPKKLDGKKPLGVNRVAPDVAALVRAAPEGATAHVEAAIRYYAARTTE
ncbi:hypothetical protein K3G63_10870 [Hymenobacter sp. HSC-4F20]|nr:hypothetical protein [Hymenobacter sp. HSC-4F20]